MPYGRLYNGSLGGARLDSASGLGDPILAAPVWLVNNSSTTFALVPYLYVPAGSYDAGRTLNVGENRWKFDLSLAACSSLVTVLPRSCPLMRCGMATTTMPRASAPVASNKTTPINFRAG
jgi:hypothetical protein